MLRRRVGAVAIGLLLLGWTHAASAHTRPAPVAVAPIEYDSGLGTFLVAATPAPDPTIVWLLGGLVLTLALAGRSSPRRTAAVALAALLSLLAFEGGVHAVHHLDDPNSRCAVASASVHIPGAEIAPVDTASILLAVTDTLPVAEPLVLPSRFTRPDEGRAPPA